MQRVKEDRVVWRGSSCRCMGCPEPEVTQETPRHLRCMPLDVKKIRIAYH